MQAYRVLDDSIRKGREAATRYPHVYSGVTGVNYGNPYGFPPMMQMMQVWSQMASTWMSMASFYGGPRQGMWEEPMGWPGAPHPGAGDGFDGGGASEEFRSQPLWASGVSTPPGAWRASGELEVSARVTHQGSPRHVLSDVYISADADLHNLQLLPLQPVAPNVAATIQGSIAREGERRVHVSLMLGDAPEGIYVGALYDRNHQQACGTIRVHLSP